MKKKRDKIEPNSKNDMKELSASKRRVFWLITILFPVILVLLVETTLRFINYGGDLDLFIEGPPGYENYLRCNPNVARRYFYQGNSVPTPPNQLFLKEKTGNTYRIFVLGGSSAAGFPYGYNASFPNFLQRGLTNTFAEKNIEIINVAMAAVNSYTLLDLTDEILDQSPDLILIYAGHNEYYGALGIGSVQSLGSWRRLINTYLELQSLRSFILLRDFIGWVKVTFGQLFSETGKTDPHATLMSRIVSEQTIPYKGDLYEIGKEQFEGNLNSILEKAEEKGVKVILGELVSNLRDQKPFISVKDYDNPDAEQVYIGAQASEAAGNYEQARTAYKRAKDLDALRFRAPEEFNGIIKKLAEKYSFPVVPLVAVFEKHSTHGLIGEELILEHLHPNMEGYHLIASAFYQTISAEQLIGENYNNDNIDSQRYDGVTELDSVYGAIVIKQLKHSWPFQPRTKPNKFLETYKPVDKLEEISFKIIKTANYNIESGHLELAEFYGDQGETDKAVREYEALIASLPHEPEFYKNVATLLIHEKKYPEADKFLRGLLKIKPSDYFAHKWTGQIALINEHYNEAINHLTKADAVDQQVVFNLARAYYSDGQLAKGEEYYIKLKNAAPNSQYTKHLSRMRVLAFIKQKMPIPKK